MWRNRRVLAVVTVFIIGAITFAFPSRAPIAAALKCEESASPSGKVILCKNEDDRSFSTKDLGSLAISVIALVLSLFSFFYSQEKDKKARRQSIEDDFWIRKILGPIAVEPMIAETLSTVSCLPPDCDSARWSQQDLVKFVTDFHPKHQQLVSALHSLALLDTATCKSVLEHMDNIEDAVLEYCSSNAAKRRIAGRSEKPTAGTQARMRDEMLKALICIKAYQTNKV